MDDMIIQSLFHSLVARLQLVGREKNNPQPSSRIGPAAIMYASERYPIFPCQPRGKKPLVKNGYKAATINTRQIRRWWSKWPDANIGIPTGRVSGFVVLDVDGKKGRDSLRTLEDKHGQLSGTVIAMTGKGWHCYYQHPGGNVPCSAGQLGLGLDFRGDGGYVVAPPSRHPSGRDYAWVPSHSPFDIELAPMPEWLIGLATKKQATNGQDGTARTSLGHKILAGMRNNTLTCLAGIMRRPGMTAGEIGAALLKVNEERCSPTLTEGEVLKIAKGINRYPPEPTRFPRTDAGNAELFAHLYGDHLKYNHRTKTWLIFDEHWWRPDTDGEVRRLAKRATRERCQLTGENQDSEDWKAEVRFAAGSENRYRQEAMLSLAQNEKPIADSGEGWDSNPWLLGVADGVIDLRTGELRDGVPEDRIRKHIDIPYDSDAECPRWQQFLSEIFGSEPELIDYIWKAVGYSLTGVIREECIFLCIGSGRNGKTTFLNVIRHIGGDYGYNTGFSTLEHHPNSTSSHDVANLEGRRLVTASETSESTRLNEARIKALTGGDPITARHLYRNESTFWPVCKIWLGTNHKPIIGDDSLGFWQRIHLIPFRQQFIGENDDRQLGTILKAESSGILAWAIKGCIKWQRDGLRPPEAVIEATKDYKEESDPLADFLADCCEPGDEYTGRSGDLYKAYDNWADNQGMPWSERLTHKVFGSRLGQKFDRKRSNKGMVYYGIKLKIDSVPSA